MSKEIKSKAFIRAKTNIIGKLKDTFLTNYSHYTVPGINIIRDNENESWDVDSALGKFQDYPYNCDLPKPLLPPIKLSHEVLMEEDPAFQLIKTKSYMKHDLDGLKTHFSKHKKDLSKTKKGEVKWEKDNEQEVTHLPRYVAEIAQIMELDPDPYFSGTYNWYYTGGTLTNISYGEKNILVFPYSEELVATPMSSYEEFLWRPNLRNGTKCQLNGVLYESRHSLINNLCRIIGRFKNHYTIYNLLIKDSKLEMIEYQSQQNSIPYISVDLSPYKVNEYCTANVERLVSVWDILRKKPVNSGSIIKTKCLDDNWGSVRYQNLDPDILVYTDRCCIHYIDAREPIERPALSLCPKANLEVCESLCFDHPSSNYFCRYIGTYHSLLLCDNRSPSQCVQQKWTHQFKGAPLLSSIVNRGNQEVIILASQRQRERIVILNDWKNENYSRSSSLPLMPPSILETLQESRLAGKCLSQSMNFRLELSNVGSTLMPDDRGQIFLFLQNSIGDIFYQGITHEEKLPKFCTENFTAVSALEEWEKAILRQSDTIIPLAFSDKSDMEVIFKSFKRSKLKYTQPEVPEKFSEPSWKQSLEQISSYVDLLAPELLSVWDVTDQSVPPVSSAPHQKVLNWLETAEATEGLTQSTISTQDSEFMPTPVGTQELVSVSQQDVIFLEGTDSFEQMFLPKVKSKTKPKEAKKRVYVPGF